MNPIDIINNAIDLVDAEMFYAESRGELIPAKLYRAMETLEHVADWLHA